MVCYITCSQWSFDTSYHSSPLPQRKNKCRITLSRHFFFFSEGGIYTASPNVNMLDKHLRLRIPTVIWSSEMCWMFSALCISVVNIWNLICGQQRMHTNIIRIRSLKPPTLHVTHVVSAVEGKTRRHVRSKLVFDTNASAFDADYEKYYKFS